MASPEDDLCWLQRALALARQANACNEVPVGAVVVYQNEVVGEGHNQPITLQDPTAHAEILALRQAAKNIGNYRLTGCTLYVTLEPCIMCIGSLIHARVQRLVFGAHDPKTGAVTSRVCLSDLSHNHNIDWQGGLLAEECSTLLQEFFRARR